MGDAVLLATAEESSEPVQLAVPDSWASLAMLPTPVTVAVPIVRFRVRSLLSLELGSIVTSGWRGGKDVPLRAGDVQIAWAEFEVTEDQLGARITRIL